MAARVLDSPCSSIMTVLQPLIRSDRTSAGSLAGLEEALAP